MSLKEEVVELFRKTATELPEDVVFALRNAKEEGYVGKEVLKTILDNIETAGKESRPICQDTGIPVFYVSYKKGQSESEIKKIIEEATEIATEQVPLRPNSIEALSGIQRGNKPVIHFEESEEFKAELMLKGGGSENVSAVYSLPNKELNANRDLEGVRRCIIDAVFKAQGKGCPPYVVGAVIGGSIEEVAHLSKKELLRKINDKNPVSELRDFEDTVLDELNQLKIGPLGLGGNATALAVKVKSGLRHPASFFVGVSIGCWCLRRQSI